MVREKKKHTLSLKMFLLCLKHEPRKSHAIFHTDFSIIQLGGMSVWRLAQINRRLFWGNLTDLQLQPLLWERGEFLFVDVIGSDHVSCQCHTASRCKVITSMLSRKDESSVVLSGWARCLMVRHNVRQKRPSHFRAQWAWLLGGSITGCKQVSRTAMQGRPCLESGTSQNQEGRESRGGKERAHEECCLLQLHRWCSRWDGRERWMDKEWERDREREKWYESTCLTVYIRSSRLETFQEKHFNIYCSEAGRKLSFLLQFVSKKNGWGAACEILILLQKSGMLKVGKLERHMVGDPEGKNTGKEHTRQAREGRGGEDTRRRRRREIKLLGGGFAAAHESAFAREQYLNSQTLCFVSYYSRQSQYSFSLSGCDKCRGNKRKMTFLARIKKRKPWQTQKLHSRLLLSNLFPDPHCSALFG